MRLTKKKALDITIELWESLAETGKSKISWSGWKEYGDMEGDCPLCEYDNRHQLAESCNCQYFDKFGGCCEKDNPFPKWEDADNKTQSKKYATELLNQLKQLRG